ncbi:hypothetical protein ABRY23_05655 [Melioribacteraceae bacterium 4301-Me]|uniref:hypothetical protein n=1 Tax=Pyranulibacter aquaticus TaxID=3163344 RepID=UPI0035961679
MRKLLKALFLLFILIPTFYLSQPKLHQLSNLNSSDVDSIFYDINYYRKIMFLNDDWDVFSIENERSKETVDLPSEFENKDALAYTKSFYLSKDQIDNYKIVINFLGINYSADINLNNKTIYKYYGGSLPLSLELPRDLLVPDSKNKITVVVSYKLNSQTTIPTKQRFLFPASFGGIIDRVYLQFLPLTNITKSAITYSIDENLTRVKLKTKLQVTDLEASDYNQNANSYYTIIINAFSKDSKLPVTKNELTFALINRASVDTVIETEIKSPLLWSPFNPNNYTVQILLLKNGSIVDETQQLISLYKLKSNSDGLYLNNYKFSINGTTYYCTEKGNGIISEKQLKKDLSLIKESGFNAVRFAKKIPRPIALKYCQEIGLLALIEIPVNSIPEEILSNNDFKIRYKSFLQYFLDYYTQFSSVSAIGIGTSFLCNSQITYNFINEINSIIKTKWNGLTYASFVGIPKDNYSALDLIGIELFGGSFNSQKNFISNSLENIKPSKFFFSEITYPNFNGSASGYLTDYSNEAEAKYFIEFIDYSRKLKMSGFVINSIYNYYGNYKSFYAGYSYNNKYNVGILDESRNLNSINYMAVTHKLLNKEKITIPIGNKKDDSPVSFILISLGLSLFMALLINTNRRFKEDCTRALFRSYNFYADIRDQRILSTPQVFILLIVVSGSLSLLATIIMYYEKQNLLFEKILISLGSSKLLNFFSLLAWNPHKSFIYFTIGLILIFILVSAIIKIASFAVKTKVSYRNIFFSMVWSFLPLTLLLPVELVLYKILTANLFSSYYFFIFLIIFMLWLLLRMLKGVYIIFDTRPILVYLYAALFFLIVFGGTALYLQISHLSFYYISNSIKQYNSMIF